MAMTDRPHGDCAAQHDGVAGAGTVPLPHRMNRKVPRPGGAIGKQYSLETQIYSYKNLSGMAEFQKYH